MLGKGKRERSGLCPIHAIGAAVAGKDISYASEANIDVRIADGPGDIERANLVGDRAIVETVSIGGRCAGENHLAAGVERRPDHQSRAGIGKDVLRDGLNLNDRVKITRELFVFVSESIRCAPADIVPSGGDVVSDARRDDRGASGRRVIDVGLAERIGWASRGGSAHKRADAARFIV